VMADHNRHHKPSEAHMATVEASLSAAQVGASQSKDGHRRRTREHNRWLIEEPHPFDQC
jgi:hypothetical protein